MSKLRYMLEHMVDGFDPPFMALERFMLRHGRDYERAPLPTPLTYGQPKMCFMNSWHALLDPRFEYVEGFAMRHDLGIPMHHAWVTDASGAAFDPTWRDAPEYGAVDYIGMVFSRTILNREHNRNGVYGVLDTGRGLNLRLLQELEPGYDPRGKRELV